MPHVIDDADWPWVARLIRWAKDGGLTGPPPVEEGPAGVAFGDKIGRTVEPIEMGEWGKVVRLAGKPGSEKPVGKPFLAYNHWGDLDAGQRVLYGGINGAKQIKQSRCSAEDTAAESGIGPDVEDPDNPGAD